MAAAAAGKPRVELQSGSVAVAARVELPALPAAELSAWTLLGRLGKSARVKQSSLQAA